jgi:hypothetical protein
MTSNRYDIQDRLTESLQRHAAPVSAGPGLAQAAHRQALRLRLRRRITAGVACLAALAVAVPVGYNVLGGPAKTDLAPIQSPTTEPRPTPSETQALVVTTPPAPNNTPERTTSPTEKKETAKAKQTPVKVTFNLDELTRGEAPKVPWYTPGVIHDGDREFAVPGLGPDAGVFFTPVGDGFLVLDYADGSTTDARARLKNANGEVIMTMPPGSFSNMIVSGDGSRLAWAEPTPDQNDWANTLVVADARTGEELHRKLLDMSDPRPVAFLGGNVVWDTDSADGGVTGLWDPETGKVSTVRGIGRTADVHGQVLLANTVLDPEEPCPGLIDHARGDRKLWSTCNHALNAISADGRYVFGQSPTTNAIVFEASNGEVLLEVDASSSGAIGNWAVEPNGDVLFDVDDIKSDTEGRQAIVRCSLDGRCELATDIVESTNQSSTLSLARSM